MFGAIILLEHPPVSNYQLSSCPRSSLFHGLQRSSITVIKTASEHDATTAMFDSQCIILRFESLTFSLPNIPVVIVAKWLNLCLV